MGHPTFGPKHVNYHVYVWAKIIPTFGPKPNMLPESTLPEITGKIIVHERE